MLQKKVSDLDVHSYIVDFICEDLQPISMVEDRGFCKFVARAFGEVKIPSRATVNKEIEKLHKQLKDKLLVELKMVNHIGMITDAWSAKHSQKSYETITLH
jgi:hypothetical protein